jgi:predicted anti-sigma-YlaC factor YlaD
MTCKEARAYMLDAAQENAAAGLDEHLRSCASCAQELESMRQTMALLDEWEAPEPSPYFDSRLRARVREAAAEPRSWLEWLRKPAIAFALAVLMVVSVTIFRNAPEHEMAKNPTPHSPNAVQTGTAVSDLQELEHDGDMYANFDMLDDLGAEAETANP